MINICDDIEEAKLCYANIAYRYAKLAIYGNDREALFFEMLRISFYIDVMERYMGSKQTKVVQSSLQGQKVSFSSLKKQNNNLILDTGHLHFCSEIEYRPCLSDERICKIVERAKESCYNCN